MSKTYIPFGGLSSGMEISRADAEDLPISKCRSILSWIDNNGKLSCFSRNDIGDTILIPHKQYLEMCQQVEEGESAIKQFKRLYSIVFE